MSLIPRIAISLAVLLLQVCLNSGIAVAAPGPLLNPNLNFVTNGTVWAIARGPDGSILLGGQFTSVNNIPRRNLAKINTDGTLDPSWDPSPNSAVRSLLVDMNIVYVGGQFSTIGGQSRRLVAKLSLAGAGLADPAWSATVTGGNIRTLALDGGGALYLGGYFDTVGGQARTHLARVSTTTGSVDVTWNPSPDEQVDSIQLDAGSVYIGGYFEIVGGQSRTYLAKLSSAGSGAVDPAWNPAPDNTVLSLLSTGSGQIYVGGTFSSIGGQTRSYLSRISTAGTGAVDLVWNPTPNNYITNVAAAPDGSIVVAGTFSAIGGGSLAYAARLASTGAGTADLSWNPGADGIIRAISVNALGDVAIGGSFSTVGSQTRRSFAAISNAGVVAPTVGDTRAPGQVRHIVSQSAGAMIVGGLFEEVNGLVRRNILRLSPDGNIDPTWNPAANGVVTLLAADSSGNVYAAGGFNHIGGASRNQLAKLSGAGSGLAVADWNPSPNSVPTAMAVHANGSVYVGGYFTNIGGLSRSFLAKVDITNGAVDALWNPAPDSVVSALAVGSSGDIYVGGYFSVISGQSRNALAKLGANGVGTADSVWNPNPDGQISALAVNSGGEIYAGGYFGSIGGQARINLAKLSGDGVGIADVLWNPSPNSTVTALTTDSAGNLFAGGYFWEAGGLPRVGVAKLSSEGSGSSDPDWDLNLGGSVVTLAMASSTTIFIGGNFTSVSGQPRSQLAAVPSSAAPPTGLAVSTGSLHYARRGHTATRLLDGRVLIAGGRNDALTPAMINVPVAEIYDPATGLFSDVGTLNQGKGRESPAANLLADGRVLVSGGYDTTSGVLATAEVFNPADGQFSYTGTMTSARMLHGSALLAGGRVLLTGGSPSATSAEIYNVATGQFTATGSMNRPRTYAIAVALKNGDVLVTGEDNSGLTNEIFSTALGTFSLTSSFGAPTSSGAMIRLRDDRILAAGGYYLGSYSATAHLFDAATAIFAPASAMNFTRNGHELTALDNGQALATGSFYGSATTELYDPLAGMFVSSVNMTSPRGDHTATQLANGRILIVGGTVSDGSTTLASAEIYTPNLIKRSGFD